MTNVIPAGPHWNKLLYYRDLKQRGGIREGKPLMELVGESECPPASREHITSDNLRLDTMRPVGPDGDDAA